MQDQFLDFSPIQDGFRGNYVNNQPSSIYPNSPLGQGNSYPSHFYTQQGFGSAAYQAINSHSLQNKNNNPQYFLENLEQQNEKQQYYHNLMMFDRTSLEETRNHLEENSGEDEPVGGMKSQNKVIIAQTAQNKHIKYGFQNQIGSQQQRVPVVFTPSSQTIGIFSPSNSENQFQNQIGMSNIPTVSFLDQFTEQQYPNKNPFIPKNNQIFPTKNIGKILYDNQLQQNGEVQTRFGISSSVKAPQKGCVQSQSIPSCFNFQNDSQNQAQLSPQANSFPSMNNPNHQNYGFSQNQATIFYDSPSNQYQSQLLQYSPQSQFLSQPQHSFSQFLANSQQQFPQQQTSTHFAEQEDQIYSPCNFINDQQIQSSQQISQKNLQLIGQKPRLNLLQQTRQYQQMQIYSQEKYYLQQQQRFLSEQSLQDQEKKFSFNVNSQQETPVEQKQENVENDFELKNQIKQQNDEKEEEVVEESEEKEEKNNSKKSSQLHYSSSSELEEEEYKYKTGKKQEEKKKKNITSKITQPIQKKFSKPLNNENNSSEIKEISSNQNHKQINETKNIPKNYSKAIIGYIQKHPLDCARLLGSEYTFNEFQHFLISQKEKLTAIKDLRQLWTTSTSSSKLQTFNRVFRILSFKFFRENAISYIYSSKKIKNTHSLITYRFILQRALHNPDSFSFMKLQN